MFEYKQLEYDFIEFFGVLPERDEYSDAIYYEVEKNGLTLSFVIPPQENIAEIYLRQSTSESLLLSVSFYVVGNINYRKEKNSEALEFQRCILVSNSSPITERNEVFDNLMFPNKVNIELVINPAISIHFF